MKSRKDNADEIKFQDNTFEEDPLALETDHSADDNYKSHLQKSEKSEKIKEFVEVDPLNMDPFEKTDKTKSEFQTGNEIKKSPNFKNQWNSNISIVNLDHECK